MRYISIDIETTGRNPEKHQILEFAAIIDDLDDPKPLNELKKIQKYICRKECFGEVSALVMNYEILKIINSDSGIYNYATEDRLWHFFKEFLFENNFDRHWNNQANNHTPYINVAGKNFGTFDKLFLERLPNWKENITIRHRILDYSPFYYKKGDYVLPSTSTCIERSGLKLNYRHNALEDCEITILLIRRAIELGLWNYK